MRRLIAAVLALVMAGALQVDAGAKTAKRAKRAEDRCAKLVRCAKVRPRVERRFADRLVDLTRTPPEASPSPGPTPPPPAPALPTFVSVAAREFSLTLSKPAVAAGSVRIELRNSGEDPHNLVVSPEGDGPPVASFSTLDPGAYERRSVPLEPGRYRLWCSLEFHEGLGMRVTLRVG